eukprot:14182512-Alexandrium_andersonii.AAC.1
MHSTIGGQVRALLTHIKRVTDKTVVPEGRLFAWAVRHAGWIVGRRLARRNGTTSYMALAGMPE